jgi:hypothetical protein
MVARRVIAAALLLLPLAVAGVSAWFVYQRSPIAYVDFEKNYEGAFVEGFHDHEKMDGRGFRWTAKDAYVHIDHLPRKSRLRVEVRIKGLRPREVQLPRVRFTANGATVFETMCAPGLVTYRFGVTLPESTLVLGIHPDVFVPSHIGRNDDRVLGVQVFSIRVEPQGGEADIARPIGWMVIAACLLLGVGWAAGLSLPLSSAGVTFLSLGFAYLMSLDSVRFLAYSQTLAVLAGLTLVVAAVTRLVLGWAGWPHRDERPVVVAVVAVSFLIKMSVLFFPLFVSSDADFQANRLLNVLEGDLYTTSVSQHDPPFQIPYPISLYVLAAPFAAAGIDRVSVLKGITALFDVGVGLVLIFLARRFLGGLRAGALAAVIYQLVPINILAFSAGNFTNLFGMATTTMFVGFLLAATAGGATISILGTFVFSFLALTAHFSTFLFGLVLWPALLGAIYLLAPQSSISERAKWLLLSAVAGSGVLALVYYTGYLDLVTSQWERVFSRDYASGTAAVAGPLEKLAFNIPFYRGQLGTVFILLAIVGGVPILMRPLSSSFHAAATAWMGVMVLFFVLDLTTALEVRYVLQTVPLLALFAGSYLSSSWERGRFGKFAVAVVLVYLVGVGISHMHESLLYRYH